MTVDRGVQLKHGNRRSRLIPLSPVILTLIFAVYLFASYGSQRDTLLLGSVVKDKHYLTLATGKYDKYGRLLMYPNKVQVSCPTQTEDMAVLLAIGQSNSANYAEKKFTTEYPKQVLNYFEGKCYIASSPLLGANNEEGEFSTPLADNLIKSGTYKSVVIISSGIGATSISRWQKNGDLNDMLLGALETLNNTYKITEVIWHQGESDFANGMSTNNYVDSFHSLMGTLENANVKARTFLAVATKCGNNHMWTADNSIATAQKLLVDNKSMFLGVNADAMLGEEDRREEDNCHLSESGQYKISSAYAESINKAHQ